MFKRIGVIFLAAIICAFCLGLGDWTSVPSGYSLVSSAEAKTNRPMTPVIVAGAARQSVRPGYDSYYGSTNNAGMSPGS